MRAVPEPKDGRPSTNHHYMLDRTFPDNVAGFLDYCAAEQRAAFFLPGLVKVGGTGKADVLSLPAVLVDFDRGAPLAGLEAAEKLLGIADIVVESGGQTESGAKYHAYWRLARPATGAEILEVCRAREALALRFGGDPAFKQPAQVIRMPGSIHFKAAPAPVRLVRAL